MRVVVQRVANASVRVEGELIAAIERGLLVFVGVTQADAVADATRLARKISALRIFDDDSGRMNLDLASVGGEILCISQFTLYTGLRRGHRPSFDSAAGRDQALPLYEAFCDEIDAAGIKAKRGIFGAEMQVSLVNDGPVTILIDTDDFETPRHA